MNRSHQNVSSAYFSTVVYRINQTFSALLSPVIQHVSELAHHHCVLTFLSISGSSGALLNGDITLVYLYQGCDGHRVDLRNIRNKAEISPKVL